MIWTSLFNFVLDLHSFTFRNAAEAEKLAKAEAAKKQEEEARLAEEKRLADEASK